MNHEYKDVTFSIGGMSVPFSGRIELGVDRAAEEADDTPLSLTRYTAGTTVVECSAIVPAGAAQNLLDLLRLRRPAGATPETLQRRVFYGGRKGRSAYRRLLREFGIVMTGPDTYDARIRRLSYRSFAFSPPRSR